MGIAGDIAYEIIDFCFGKAHRRALFIGTKLYHAEEVFEAIDTALKKYNAGHLISRYSTHKNRLICIPEIHFMNGSMVRGFVPVETNRDHGLLHAQHGDLIITVDKENIHPDDIIAIYAMRNSCPGGVWKEYSWT